jgi:solute carrier family 25 (adenine nucleotide translocator) protein 4/5/6/31
VVEHQFEGTWDVWRQAVARSGFGGLYHGLGVSLAGVLVFRGLYFGAYDLALYLLPAKLKRNDWVCFLTAVGVTVGSAFVAYPLDTMRYAPPHARTAHTAHTLTARVTHVAGDE